MHGASDVCFWENKPKWAWFLLMGMCSLTGAARRAFHACSARLALRVISFVFLCGASNKKATRKKRADQNPLESPWASLHQRELPFLWSAWRMGWVLRRLQRFPAGSIGGLQCHTSSYAALVFKWGLEVGREERIRVWNTPVTGHRGGQWCSALLPCNSLRCRVMCAVLCYTVMLI